MLFRKKNSGVVCRSSEVKNDIDEPARRKARAEKRIKRFVPFRLKIAGGCGDVVAETAQHRPGYRG